MTLRFEFDSGGGVRGWSAHQCLSAHDRGSVIASFAVSPMGWRGVMPLKDDAEWMQAFRINTMASLKMAETFAPHIARSKQKTIVTITSKMGSIADNSSGGSYLYRSSKAAVNMVVKSLAIDLKPLGITTVVCHPGRIHRLVTVILFV